MNVAWPLTGTSCLFATSKRDGSRSRFLEALPKPAIPMAANTSMSAIVVAGRDVVGGRGHPRPFKYSDHPTLPSVIHVVAFTTATSSITTSNNSDMLKRQRPATPPPSSLDDPASFLPTRLLQPLHTIDPSHPRSKRQRTQPPSLDGALRGWLESESAGPHWESDGEEDWTEDPYGVLGSPLPPSTTVNQYKDANSLLHELHVLNQHRLLFARPPRDRRLGPCPGVPPPTAHTHIQDPPAGQRPAAWADGSPYHRAHPQFTRDEMAGRSCRIESVERGGLIEEVQCVRQHYEDANRCLAFPW